MTRAEQRRFVRDLARNVLARIVERSEHWPAEWDGHELRQLLADAFADASFTLKERHHRARWKAYRNTILTSPGLW